MLGETYSRFRERRKPPQKSGKFVGKLYKKFKVNNNVSTTQTFVTSSASVSADLERCWDQINPPPYLVGGPFTKYKLLSEDAKVKHNISIRSKPDIADPTFYWLYEGGFAGPDFSPWDTTTASAYNNAALSPIPGVGIIPSVDQYGSQAYRSCRPQLEKASLAVALREAKDIPGMLRTSSQGFHNIWESLGGSRTSALMHPKHVADHFLNHVFGWAPFISDLIKFNDVYQNSERYIDQITRDNGLWVRRRRLVEETQSVTKLSSGSNTGLVPTLDLSLFCNSMGISGGVHQYANWTVREEINSRVWAEGLFTYYRPEFDRSLPDYYSQWSDLQRRLTIYGARLSPSNIYKSTPWTWLIDWFLNVGSVVDQINDIALDGVVSKYFFVMRHLTRRLIYNILVNFWTGPQAVDWYRLSDFKIRQVANSPYGYSLPSGGLSTKQLAILAALGISRWA